MLRKKLSKTLEESLRGSSVVRSQIKTLDVTKKKEKGKKGEHTVGAGSLFHLMYRYKRV